MAGVEAAYERLWKRSGGVHLYRMPTRRMRGERGAENAEND